MFKLWTLNKRILLVVALELTTVVTDLQAEMYTIDAANVEKEIRLGNFSMGTAVNSSGEAIETNNYYLLKGGKPWFPVMGEIHYSRWHA